MSKKTEIAKLEKMIADSRTPDTDKEIFKKALEKIKSSASKKKKDDKIYLKEIKILSQEGKADIIVKNKSYYDFDSFKKQINANVENQRGYNKNRVLFIWEDGFKGVQNIDSGPYKSSYDPSRNSLEEYIESLLMEEGEISDKYVFKFKPSSSKNAKKSPKKKGVESMLKAKPDPKDPTCDDLLEAHKKRFLQRKKQSKKPPITPGDAIKKAAERAKNKIKGKKLSIMELNKIESGLKALLDSVSNKEEAKRHIIKKLK